LEDTAYKLAIYIEFEGMGEDFGLVAHEDNRAVMSRVFRRLRSCVYLAELHSAINIVPRQSEVYVHTCTTCQLSGLVRSMAACIHLHVHSTPYMSLVVQLRTIEHNALFFVGRWTMISG
jgi:hypothetical protein